MASDLKRIAAELKDRHTEPAPSAAPLAAAAPIDSTTALVDAMHAAPPEAVHMAGQSMGAATAPAVQQQQMSVDGAANPGPAFDFSDPNAAAKASAQTDLAMRHYRDPGAFDTNAPPPPNPIGTNGVPTSIAKPAVDPNAPVATDSSMPGAQPAMPAGGGPSIPGQLSAIDAQTRQAGAQNMGDIEQSKQLALQGAKEQAEAKQVYNTAIAPQLAEKVKVEQHAAELTKQANDWMQEQTAQERRHTFEMRDRYMAEAARDPTNLWGNWSTSQKIGGIIGIVAAGFAHQDATARVEHLVDMSVADSNRRMENLKLVSEADRKIEASNTRVYGSKMNAANAEKASKLEIIAQQMEQTANSVANPIAKANLLTTSAAIMGNVVKIREDVAKTTLSLRLQNVDEQLKLREIQGREEIARISASKMNPRTQTWFMEDARRRKEGEMEGFVDPEDPSRPGYGNPTNEKLNNFKDAVQGSGHSMIDALNEAKSMIGNIQRAIAAGDAGEAERIRQRYNKIKSNLITPWRIYTRSGANITGAEKDDFDNTLPSFFRSATGLGEIMQDIEGLNMAQYMIVNNIKNTGESLAHGTAKFNPNYERYAPILAWNADNHRAQERLQILRDKRFEARKKYREQQGDHYVSEDTRGGMMGGTSNAIASGILQAWGPKKGKAIGAPTDLTDDDDSVASNE